MLETGEEELMRSAAPAPDTCTSMAGASRGVTVGSPWEETTSPSARRALTGNGFLQQALGFSALPHGSKQRELVCCLRSAAGLCAGSDAPATPGHAFACLRLQTPSSSL